MAGRIYRSQHLPLPYPVGAAQAGIFRQLSLWPWSSWLKHQLQQGDPRWQWAHFGGPLRELATERGRGTGEASTPAHHHGLPVDLKCTSARAQIWRSAAHRSSRGGLTIYRK